MGTIAASDNEFPKVIFVEGAAPGTPPAGFVYVYAKADSLLYWKDDTGTEHSTDIAAHLADTSDAHDASAVSVADSGNHFTGTDVEAVLAELFTAISGAGSVATDVIWDAAGDLAVGSGANTAARLAIGGTNGMVLTRVSGAVAWALPPGYLWDAVSTTSSTTLTATTEGTAHTVLTSNSVTFDGAPVEAIFRSSAVDTPAVSAASVIILIYEDSTLLGRFGTITNTTQAALLRMPVNLRYSWTPSAAAHTVTVKAYVSSGTGSVGAGAGGSATNLAAQLRIKKV